MPSNDRLGQMPRSLSVVAAIALTLAGAACDGSDSHAPREVTPIATAWPAEESAFDALPGATAHRGSFNGGLYGVEVPEGPNGTLVLYLKGGRRFVTHLDLETPRIREYLIDHGYTWASISYDRNTPIVAAAADQNAAFVEFFKKKFFDPERILLYGSSAGGAVAIAMAEEEDSEYDAAFVLCGTVGLKASYDIETDYFVAAAFATGVNQTDFRTTPVDDLLYNTIVPRLDTNAAARARFEETWVAITGGDRPFAHEGLYDRELALRALSILNIQGGLTDNLSRDYRSRPSELLDSLDAEAIRMFGETARLELTPRDDASGELRIPILTLHTTGDGIVPLRHQQILAERVRDAGESHRLVQRAVRSPWHCDFLEEEVIEAFTDLVDWLETGNRPRGEDLLNFDPETLGEEFTLDSDPP